MKVTFYGVRGSIPVSGERYLKYGGNTTCALLQDAKGGSAILDAGTGIRQLGKDIASSELKLGSELFVLLSHTHWDHIQGFPFFAPAYMPGYRLTMIISGRAQTCSDLEDIFKTQSQKDFFPVPLDKMAAEIGFYQPDLPGLPGRSGNQVVDFYKHNHPGGAYSYRLRAPEGTEVVYSTDIEHGENIDEGHVRFCEGADLLIHDGQYTPDELPSKRGWGHSSWTQAVEVAERANVKRLAITHHDPDHDDAFLDEVEALAQARFPNCFLTREGLTVQL